MNNRVPTDTVITILKNYKEYIDPQSFESLELAYAIGRAVESLKNEKKRNCWISIDKQLPTEKDADMDGLILIKYSRGSVREASWGFVVGAVREKIPDCRRGWLISWARMPEVEDP